MSGPLVATSVPRRYPRCFRGELVNWVVRSRAAPIEVWKHDWTARLGYTAQYDEDSLADQMVEIMGFVPPPLPVAAPRPAPSIREIDLRLYNMQQQVAALANQLGIAVPGTEIVLSPPSEVLPEASPAEPTPPEAPAEPPAPRSRRVELE